MNLKKILLIPKKIKMRIKFGIAIIYIMFFGCQNNKDLNQFSEGKIMHEDWYKNGKLKSRVWHNKELKKDSLGLWFYENGNPQVKAQFSNGKQIGPSTYYYSNGDIKSYYFYNEEGDGSAMYGQKYNEIGELIEEKGLPIGVVYENGLRVDFKDYFDFTVIAATPPTSEMKINIVSKEGSTLNFMNRTTYQVKDKMPFFKHYFDSKGEHLMLVISELNDTIRNIIRRDTISFIVSVE